jgi:hypothetical protein
MRRLMSGCSSKCRNMAAPRIVYEISTKNYSKNNALYITCKGQIDTELEIFVVFFEVLINLVYHL